MHLASAAAAAAAATCVPYVFNLIYFILFYILYILFIIILNSPFLLLFPSLFVDWFCLNLEQFVLRMMVMVIGEMVVR